MPNPTLTSKFKQALQMFLINPEDQTKKDQLVQVAVQISREVFKESNGISADKGMTPMDLFLKPLMQDIKISRHSNSGLLLDELIRQLGEPNLNNDEMSLAFSPLSLAYNNYLKKNFVSELEENIRKDLLLLEEQVAPEDATSAALLNRLKNLLIPYFNFPPLSQADSKNRLIKEILVIVQKIQSSQLRNMFNNLLSNIRLLQHSQLFNDLVHSCKSGEFSEVWLDPEGVKQNFADEDFDYQAMSDLLREVNDAQFGIISTVNCDNEWVRDATKGIPLDMHNAPVIEANNMLLRCLSRLRPIDYVIGKKFGNKEPALQLHKEIRETFSQLSEEILQIAQSKEKNDKEKLKKINEIEKRFNTFLVKELHVANLTKGCETVKDAEKLLMHYRNLSSVLTPSRPLVTLTYDEVTGVLQRETQYPVTDKTQMQKEAIKKLEKLSPYPFEEEKNAHTVHNLATQEADSLFADLIGADDRALPAQTRKTHLIGAKNAFIVKNELIKINDPAEIEDLQNLANLKATRYEDILWLARSGSPVYLGNGENHKQVQMHTRENLQQIREVAAEKIGMDPGNLYLAVIILNTDSPLQQQDKIVANVLEATRKNKAKGDYGSYMPTNLDGTMRFIDVDPRLELLDNQPRPVGSHPLQKGTRVKQIAKVALKTDPHINNTLTLVHCASGQDRTGTVVEKTTQLWMKDWYERKNLDISNIDSMRAAGGNPAEIASHHLPGSPGMKSYSKADNVFGEGSFNLEANQQFYRKSANTNKKNRVGNVDFLLWPHDSWCQEYLYLEKAFIINLKKNKELREKGYKLLEEMEALYKKSNLSAKELTDLCLVLTYANQTMESPQDPENLLRLASLSKHVSGKESPGWKRLGIALLCFGILALIGLLLTIPTGGVGLLFTTMGVSGLGVTIGSIATGTTVGASWVAGFAFFAHNRKKGLAKATSEFRGAMEDNFVVENAPNMVDP
jgi:hypothetical protein